MALLERVATLLRANLNDLIDRAEHPEKMLRQVILDMENQLMQVKTQVAIAVADHHLLTARRDENAAKEQEFVRKAELAVEKGEEPLARIALERALNYRQTTASFDQQVTDQQTQLENLKTAFRRLQGKLVEARSLAETLAAQQRRARALNQAADAQGSNHMTTFERARQKVEFTQALAKAKTEMLDDADDEQRLAALEKQEQVEQLLTEIKNRKRRIS